MKQIHAYKIDLARIDGEGDFSCPRCDTKISPDDETEEAYSIEDTVMGSQGLLELAIRCNKCSSQIHVTGFFALKEIPVIDEDTSTRIDHV